jgi:hypothetical protein
MENKIKKKSRFIKDFGFVAVTDWGLVLLDLEMNQLSGSLKTIGKQRIFKLQKDCCCRQILKQCESPKRIYFVTIAMSFSASKVISSTCNYVFQSI